MAKPDYAFWDAQPDYTLPQTLALCCDQEPPLVEFGPKHEAILWRLVTDFPAFHPAIQHGFLDEASADEVHISKEALRQWAEGTGQRKLMPFLFPEDREPPKKKRIEQPSVSTREETTVLEILGAILQAMYGDDILDDLTSPRSQRFKEVFDDVRRKTKISDDTLRKYLKRIPR